MGKKICFILSVDVYPIITFSLRDVAVLSLNEVDHLIRYNLFTGFLFDTVQKKNIVSLNKMLLLGKEKEGRGGGTEAEAVLSILLLKQFLLRSILTLIGWLCLAKSQIGEKAIAE